MQLCRQYIAKVVNIELKDATINQILDIALKDENVIYDVYERQIVIQKSDIKLVNNQQVTMKVISGNVIDANGLPITGVAVMVKGTTIGITTDIDGKFKLSVPVDSKKLVFSGKISVFSDITT